MMYGYGQNLGYGNMLGGGWLGLLMMLFFGALVIAGIVVLVMWAVRSSSGHGHPAAVGGSAAAPGHDEAVAIAKRRFASGEITKEQFDELMRSLVG
jgi:putative membrane protein